MTAHDDALRAGARLLAGGEVSAARAAFECAEDGAGGSLAAGLAAGLGAVERARRGDWAGASRGARGAARALDGRAPTFRAYLESLAADPETVERRRPPAPRVGDTEASANDSPFGVAACAARAVARTDERYDDELIGRAVAYAREELDTASTPLAALLTDFAAGRERGLVYRRLAAHVDRRRREERDVAGLFDPE